MIRVYYYVPDDQILTLVAAAFGLEWSERYPMKLDTRELPGARSWGI